VLKESSARRRWGEVFNLATIAAMHGRVVNVVPTKNVLQYGGKEVDDLFPVQVRLFFLLGYSGSGHWHLG
jgi:hypothetical protein